MDAVRRIVSGKKARTKEEGYDLDLVRLTDRIILMGYPADGFEALYRNRRSDAVRFLESLRPYRIFNLVPRFEKSYNAADFAPENGEGSVVERFPWPDHHSPPLSLLPLAAARAKEWYEADERNTVVIHCIAGKGRTGSLAISLLLALPGLPSAPELEGETEDGSNGPLDPRAVVGSSKEEIASMTMSQKLEYLLRFHTMRRMSPGAKSYGVSIASQRRFLGYFARLLEHNDPRSPLSLSSPPPSPRRILLESITIVGPGLAGAGKVLSGGKDKLSVQIFRYKDDIAAELRRHELQLAEAGRPTPIDDEEWDDRSDMFFRVGGFVEGPSSKSPSAPTAEASAPTAAAPSVPTLPASISSSVSASTSSLPSIIDADASSSTDSVASLPPVSNTAVTASQSASSSRPSRSRTLVPYASFVPPAANPLEVVNPPRRSEKEAKAVAKAEVGIVLDGDREVQLRFLVGETGKKHGKLPAMASLAIFWFIPAFESPPSQGERATLVLKAKELDFLKPFAGIEEVTVAWRWLP